MNYDCPRVLLKFDCGDKCVGYWDAYYAKGGRGHVGGSGWVEAVSGEQLDDYYNAPIAWMNLPEQR